MSLSLSTLRARAAHKGLRIEKRDDTYTLIDTDTDANNEEVLASVEGLLALEDKINWIDAPSSGDQGKI